MSFPSQDISYVFSEFQNPSYDFFSQPSDVYSPSPLSKNPIFKVPFNLMKLNLFANSCSPSKVKHGPSTPPKKASPPNSTTKINTIKKKSSSVPSSRSNDSPSLTSSPDCFRNPISRSTNPSAKRKFNSASLSNPGSEPSINKRFSSAYRKSVPPGFRAYRSDPSFKSSNQSVVSGQNSSPICNYVSRKTTINPNNFVRRSAASYTSPFQPSFCNNASSKPNSAPPLPFNLDRVSNSSNYSKPFDFPPVDNNRHFNTIDVPIESDHLFQGTSSGFFSSSKARKGFTHQYDYDTSYSEPSINSESTQDGSDMINMIYEHSELDISPQIPHNKSRNTCSTKLKQRIPNPQVRNSASFGLQRTAPSLPLLKDIISQQGIECEARHQLIKWLSRINSQISSSLDSLFLAINIVDRFSSIQSVHSDSLYIVGAVALYIAMRFCSSTTYSIPKYMDYLNLDDLPQYFNSVESDIVRTIKYNLAFHYPITILDQLFEASGFDNLDQMVSKYLIESTLTDPRFWAYTPNVIAATCIYIACKSRGVDNWDRLFPNVHKSHQLKTIYKCEQTIYSYLLERKSYNTRTFLKYNTEECHFSSSVIHEWMAVNYQLSEFATN
ncbi:hypothetical protein BB560_004958 [Smittium megazygosporum]|uniref:Cyclin N-terminal domain-containing protein n=1 Tax=Smittium megazygosporum TaxID=133381 RepID=A0A2T9Z7Z0_9FUNG|nr:hypothetical protein BB560_004958 [Smittium megazygosporum]